MRAAILLSMVLSLSGCLGVPAAGWVAASGGILVGAAAVTNADVNAAEAYCRWRNGCGATVP
jgi:hypothetical protein